MTFSGDHHRRAVGCVASLRASGSAVVDWVSPIISTMLAAEKIRRQGPLDLSFTGSCDRYARHIGLDCAAAGLPLPLPEPKKNTYSPLARLASHDDVDHALDIVTPVLHQYLPEEHKSTINEVCRIVGELHDNVASHASGAGFSALQVYSQIKKVELAVVDAGVGLLANVRRVEPSVSSHQGAIHWCLQKGNTTARSSSDGFEQRLPPDAQSNPYPPGIATRVTENSHLGEGLWQLHQLVMHLGGRLWLLTGNAELLVSPEEKAGRYRLSSIEWPGVAVEVILPVVAPFVAPPGEHDETIAKRFGI